MSRDIWNPQQYRAYASHRARPFFELLGRVDVTAPAYVVDLGCGPGERTADLAARWPGAVIEGIDSSAQMITEAWRTVGERPGLRQGGADDMHADADARPGADNAEFEWGAPAESTAGAPGYSPAAGPGGPSGPSGPGGPGGPSPSGTSGPGRLGEGGRGDSEDPDSLSDLSGLRDQGQPAGAGGPPTPGGLTAAGGLAAPGDLAAPGGPADSGDPAGFAGSRPGLRFSVGDLAAWVPERPVDVIFSNAALQWVPGHQRLLPGWVKALAPGGRLAFSMPGNFDGPSHRILRELCESPRWRDRLGEVNRHNVVGDPADYFELLSDLGCDVDAWETTYLQVLHGTDPVLEWMKGTALRPALDALPEEAEREEFLAELTLLIREAYPPGPHGTLFPFRRIFVVASRPDTEPTVPPPS